MSIQTDLTRIKNAKSAIKAAIEGKGVTVPDGTLLDGMAALIDAIEAGGGGATEPYIEEVYDGDGELIDVTFHGYTIIRKYAFNGCKSLALTSLPSGLTSIGTYAFNGCSKLALTSLPSGLTSIGAHAFDGCSSLALTSLPSGLTSIGTYAFSGCSKLALTSLPSGLTSIGNYTFRNCKSLASLTFEGTPTSIGTYAFSGCTNLTTINVPWAEGAVANAPWGATNATINYNYTGA